MNFFQWLQSIFQNKGNTVGNDNSGQIPEPNNPSAKVMGLDIYHGDTVTDWTLVDKSCQFAYIKATQGTGYQDPHFAANMKGARSAGLIAGAYHFVDLAADGKAQANYFCDYIQVNGGCDFAVLDWETGNSEPHSAFDIQTVKAFLDQVKVRVGKRCFIYAGYYLVQATSGDKSFLAEYPLIVPSYSAQPKAPAPWTSVNIWQDGESASITGVAGHSDHDVFRGDLDDFRNLISYCSLGGA